jgi:hypothetical protein
LPNSRFHMAVTCPGRRYTKPPPGAFV